MERIIIDEKEWIRTHRKRGITSRKLIVTDLNEPLLRKVTFRVIVNDEMPSGDAFSGVKTSELHLHSVQSGAAGLLGKKALLKKIV